LVATLQRCRNNATPPHHNEPRSDADVDDDVGGEEEEVEEVVEEGKDDEESMIEIATGFAERWCGMMVLMWLTRLNGQSR